MPKNGKKKTPAEAAPENRAENFGPLVDEACEAYGIWPEHVLGSGIDRETGQVVIVTSGGKKVRYFAGDKPEPLSQIEVTGVNPEAAKRKIIAGKKKK